MENTGSAPFYEDWPVEFSLLDPETHLPVWKTVLDGVDIRDWLPGDKWETKNEIYSIPADGLRGHAGVPTVAKRAAAPEKQRGGRRL